MFSFLEAVRAHLQVHVTPIIKYGVLDITPSSVALRTTPTAPGERYLTGSNEAINFQVLVKDKAQDKVMQTFDTIVSLLDGKVIPGASRLISCHLYTTPNFVQKTDTNEFIYTALFQAEIEGEDS